MLPIRTQFRFVRSKRRGKNLKNYSSTLWSHNGVGATSRQRPERVGGEREKLEDGEAESETEKERERKRGEGRVREMHFGISDSICSAHIVHCAVRAFGLKTPSDSNAHTLHVQILKELK